MAPKSSNENIITSTNNTDVGLKFEQDVDRTWVDKDKFQELHDDYEEPQENSSLNTSSDVQFRIIITSKDIETGALEAKIVFPDMTKIYGGIDGINMFFTIPTYSVSLSL